jgi:hypothetical protein
MLTGDLVRPRLRIRGRNLYIDTIRANDPHWLDTASELIALFRAQVGQPQRAWHEALEEFEGERLDYIVIRGIAKVLTDAATFTTLVTPISPVELRERLFARGPAFPAIDLFYQHTRQDIIRAEAKALRTSQKMIEAMLFADRPDEHVLTDAGPEWTPEALLTRYNLELARGALYWCSGMQIEIQDSYKDIWRYIKLFKLMFEARALENGGYHLDLDGPISPFVTHTLRYGRQFAAFLPALFLCERWQMMATVHSPQAGRSHDTLIYRLDHTSPLQSHFKRSGLFDSRLERDLAVEFEEKFGGERGQWALTREDEVILLGDTVMIPDFALTNKRDGRRAIVEIVGFWHPNYLRRKVAKVRAANRRDLILLVYEGINLSQEQLQDVPGEVLYFKNKPVLKDVMAAVEAVAQ